MWLEVISYDKLSRYNTSHFLLRFSVEIKHLRLVLYMFYGYTLKIHKNKYLSDIFKSTYIHTYRKIESEASFPW